MASAVNAPSIPAVPGPEGVTEAHNDGGQVTGIASGDDRQDNGECHCGSLLRKRMGPIGVRGRRRRAATESKETHQDSYLLTSLVVFVILLLSRHA